MILPEESSAVCLTFGGRSGKLAAVSFPSRHDLRHRKERRCLSREGSGTHEVKAVCYPSLWASSMKSEKRCQLSCTSPTRRLTAAAPPHA